MTTRRHRQGVNAAIEVLRTHGSNPEALVTICGAAISALWAAGNMAGIERIEEKIKWCKRLHRQK